MFSKDQAISAYFKSQQQIEALQKELVNAKAIKVQQSVIMTPNTTPKRIVETPVPTIQDYYSHQMYTPYSAYIAAQQQSRYMCQFQQPMNQQSVNLFYGQFQVPQNMVQMSRQQQQNYNMQQLTPQTPTGTANIIDQMPYNPMLMAQQQDFGCQKHID